MSSPPGNSDRVPPAATGDGSTAPGAVLLALFFCVPILMIAAAVGARSVGVVDGAPGVRDRVLRYRDEARAAAESAGVELTLVLAVCSVESRGRPDARSPVGAVGLMQLLPATADELAALAGEGKPDLTDPATSLRLGARYLRAQIDGFAGRPCARELALAAYNAGPRRVKEWLRKAPLEPGREHLGDWVPFPETRAYVQRVIDWEQRFLEEAARPR